MATEQYDGADLMTASAAADLTGKETFLAVINSSGLVAIAGANVVVDAVILIGALQSRPVTLQLEGIARVTAGGTFSPGVPLASNASGQAVAATTGQFAFGRSREGGVSGKVVSVILDRHTAP